MNLTANQIIDFISEHTALAKGEKISLAWAYYAFGYEISQMRHDLIRYLEDKIMDGDNSLLLNLHRLFHEDEYDALSLEQEIETYASR